MAVYDTWLRQRVVLLAAQDVEMQGVEQLGNGSDLVRLAVDLAVPRRPPHSLPGGSLCPTRTGRAPVGSRQLRLAHRVRTPSQERAGPQPRSFFPSAAPSLGASGPAGAAARPRPPAGRRG